MRGVYGIQATSEFYRMSCLPVQGSLSSIPPPCLRTVGSPRVGSGSRKEGYSHLETVPFLMRLALMSGTPITCPPRMGYGRRLCHLRSHQQAQGYHMHPTCTYMLRKSRAKNRDIHMLKDFKAQNSVADRLPEPPLPPSPHSQLLSSAWT